MTTPAEKKGVTLAQRLRIGRDAIHAALRAPIRLRPDNFVERPWGGLSMLDYKRRLPLPDQKKITGLGVGEAFETAACASDAESDAHPSIAVLPDESQIPLPELLACAGPQVLGASLYARHGGEIPLLPKTLDIAELLSVQAHPPGNTELYVIIDAEPGASIRLGFRHSVDAESLGRELAAGRRKQQQLAGLLRRDVDLHQFNASLAPLLARRDGTAAAAGETLTRWLRSPAELEPALELFDALREVYWHLLDLMNEVIVRPGQVIYNATPARISAVTGAPPSAEVHALGNPEGREILLLEIRRPGVTYRAWDNVRFPMRDIDIDLALQSMNLGATSAGEYDVTPQPTASPGVSRLVECAAFVVDDLKPRPDRAIDIAAGQFQTLHVVEGQVTLDSNGVQCTLPRGQSALVPACCDGGVIATNGSARVIRVTIPEPGAQPG